MGDSKRQQALDAWREAEKQYAKAVFPYLADNDSQLRLKKKGAMKLSRMRAKADSRMQKYLKHASRKNG